MTQPTRILFVIGAIAAGPATAAAQELAADEAAVAAHIASLKSPDSGTRAAAAAELRRLVAKYPSGTVYLSRPGDGGAAWRAKVRRIGLGTPRDESLKLLPPAPGHSGEGGLAEGQHTYASYRLDRHWWVRVCYHNDGHVVRRPELLRSTEVIDVRPPDGFTGVWTTWYVTGRKARDDRYAAGKLDGVQTRYHDNGTKEQEQHYAAGVAHGPSTGWYPDGRPEHAYHYRDGKQDGTCTRWYEGGGKLDETAYVAGRHHGRQTYWYPSGQVSLINDYDHGVLHGTGAAWGEDGVQHFKRRYVKGAIVETFEDGRPVE